MDADVWILVGKIALLSFLILGPAIVVITYDPAAGRPRDAE